jgi:hypothetical protein
MLVDGDLDFSNDYRHYLQLQPAWFDHQDLPRDPVTRLPMNLYGVGSALLWAPYVAATHAWLRLTSSPQADGFSRPYERAIALGTALHVTLALVLLWRLLARLAGRWGAFWAVIVLWLATPLFLYTYLHPSMSHGNSFLAVVLMLTFLLSRPVVQGRPLAWAGLGLAGGLVILVRFQDGILLLAPILAEAVRVWHRGIHQRLGLGSTLLRRTPAYLAAIAAGGLTLTLQMAAWSVLQGTWWSGPRAYTMQGRFDLTSPHLLQVWFSAYHGLFHWHPVLILGLLGLLITHRGTPFRAVALGAFLGASYVVGCWSVWWAGASFGHRMMISSFPFLALGLAYLAAHPRRPQHQMIWAGIVALAIAWNFGAVFQYGTGMIPRNRPVPITTLARNTTVEIPQLLWQRLTGQPSRPADSAVE